MSTRADFRECITMSATRSAQGVHGRTTQWAVVLEHFLAFKRRGIRIFPSQPKPGVNFDCEKKDAFIWLALESFQSESFQSAGQYHA